MLLDSNIVIYAFDPAYGGVARFLRGKTVYTSVLTKIEVMGFGQLTENEYRSFALFFNELDIIAVTSEIVDRAIDLRRKRKMGLADSVIAASALLNNFPLVTHNVRDFDWIPGLQLIDPVSDANF
jgi:predicted nucleic acid-binding protein